MTRKIQVLIIALVLHTGVYAQLNSKTNNEVVQQTAYALELCKVLHQNPELSFQEFETAERMAAELKNAGFEVTEKFGGNSVIGVLKNGEGPVIMIRTDMDGLPVQEKTEFEFASSKMAKTENGNDISVMHACGHDIHMSVWTGTIRTLAALKDRWKGTLLVVAQMAEESGEGANKAIAAGLFSKFPVPDYAMAFHINPELESGTIGLSEGPVFAGVETAEITVYGEGGHGAMPQNCIDPIVIASRIVLDLQTIVSREISPLETAVVTVGSIHGGTRPNIIPEEVKMELTLRYYSDEVIEKVVAAIRRISKSAAQMAGMPDDRLPLVTILPVETLPVINDSKLAEKIKDFATASIGAKNIVKSKPVMGGEDFSMYGRTPEKVPICIMWLGSTNPGLMKELNAKGEQTASLHSPYLHPDFEKTIETGIKVMVGNVIGLSGK